MIELFVNNFVDIFGYYMIYRLFCYELHSVFC